MSVPNDTFQNTYLTDGVTNTYDFTWATAGDVSFLQVYLNNVLQGPGSYNAFLNTTTPGGFIQFLPGAVPPAGMTLLLQRVADDLQLVNLANNAPLPPVTLTQMFDKLTILAQQVAQQVALSLSLSLTVAAEGVSAVLPPPVPGGIIEWDNTGLATAYIVPVKAGYVLTDNGPGNEATFQPPTGGGGGGGGNMFAGGPYGYANEVLVASNIAGTTTTGIPSVAIGNVLTDNGPGNLPTFQAPASGSTLRAAAIKVAGRQLPTSGPIEGVYNHFGNWTQSGNITYTSTTVGPVRIFINGNMTFINGFSFSPNGIANQQALGGQGTTQVAQSGAGLGGGKNTCTYAANTAGGAGGSCGGIGGNGGSNSTTTFNNPSQTYDFTTQMSGSGGSGGNSSTAGQVGGIGGIAGSGVYLEVTGNIALSTVANAPSIDVGAQTVGGNPSSTSQGAGGGAAGGVCVIRCGGAISGGNGTNSISATGTAGGNSTTGGGGGGGGGGIIDIQAAGLITATGFNVAGGVAGTGSATKPAGAGQAGTVRILASTPVFSAF